MTEHLLADKQAVGRIREAGHLFLFLDYDGTLAPFHDNPRQAAPLPGIPSLLTSLAVREEYTVSLISGRSLEDLKQMVSLSEVNYAGNHGLQIELADGGELDWVESAGLDLEPLLDIREWFANNYGEKPGYRLEDKGTVLTFHYPADESSRRLLDNLEAMITSGLEIITGRQIVEVRPTGWNKGRAVEYICEYYEKKYQLKEHLTVYLGDDTTDEDAFRILEEQGIGIYVTNGEERNTAADYFLENPREVKKLLKILL
ncbi:MAG: trehalose-phosphatase [Halanaerobiaceae bacterium]